MLPAAACGRRGASARARALAVARRVALRVARGGGGARLLPRPVVLYPAVPLVLLLPFRSHIVDAAGGGNSQCAGKRRHRAVARPRAAAAELARRGRHGAARGSRRRRAAARESLGRRRLRPRARCLLVKVVGLRLAAGAQATELLDAADGAASRLVSLKYRLWRCYTLVRRKTRQRRRAALGEYSRPCTSTNVRSRRCCALTMLRSSRPSQARRAAAAPFCRISRRASGEYQPRCGVQCRFGAPASTWHASPARKGRARAWTSRAAAARWPEAEGRGERRLVNELAARRVDEERARRQLREERGVDEAGGRRVAVAVEREAGGLRSELAQRGGAADAQRLVGAIVAVRVVEDDVEAERLRAHRRRRPDPTEADEPEGGAAHAPHTRAGAQAAMASAPCTASPAASRAEVASVPRKSPRMSASGVSATSSVAVVGNVAHRYAEVARRGNVDVVVPDTHPHDRAAAAHPPQQRRVDRDRVPHRHHVGRAERVGVNLSGGGGAEHIDRREPFEPFLLHRRHPERPGRRTETRVWRRVARARVARRALRPGERRARAAPSMPRAGAGAGVGRRAAADARATGAAAGAAAGGAARVATSVVVGRAAARRPSPRT